MHRTGRRPESLKGRLVADQVIMQKLANSDAKLFKFADSVFDETVAAWRKITNHPKTVFRAVFAITCIVGALAISFEVMDAIDAEVKHHEFNKRHSDLLQVMRSNDQQKYTIEQRAIAFKMFSCVSQGKRYRNEEYCSAQLVSDAAINGGEQRASAVKSNLRELGFSVADWL
jgi:hypothetical protein